MRVEELTSYEVIEKRKIADIDSNATLAPVFLCRHR